MAYPYTSKVLERLGVRSWLNARNWSSVIGGCWIDDEVLQAMNEVAKTFVDMHELFARADGRVAELCRADDAHIVPGAGAGIELSVAGCMAGSDLSKWMRLPDTTGMKNEVLFPRSHHHAYTPQWTVPGARLVEYGQAGILQSCVPEIEAGITEKTCCLAYTVSYNNSPRGKIPLEEVIAIGKRHDIPVVIDAASMLPPVSNLWKFLEMGSDLVIFSGGKAIQAPSSTGIILGNGRGAEIIASIRDHTYPHGGWGRGHKISKEQVVGLVVALERFLVRGDTLYANQLMFAEFMAKGLRDIPGLDVRIIPNDETYHEHPDAPHVPRVLFTWDAAEIGMTGEDLDEVLVTEDPPIYLKERHYHEYYTNREWRIIETYFLRPGEEAILVDRIRRALNRE